jgi:hypothetical protein
LEETPERGTKPLTGRLLRPQPLGHIWAWIVLAVGVVILMVIALWVVTAGQTETGGLAHKQVIHDVSSRWRDRWAQVPGPPTEYLQSANEALMDHRLADASRWLSMSISLAPGDAVAWIRMTCVSVAYSSAYQMTDTEIDGVLSALASTAHIGPSVLANWRVQRSRLAGNPDETGPWVARCAGVGGSPEQIESQGKTLDTIEATP